MEVARVVETMGTHARSVSLQNTHTTKTLARFMQIECATGTDKDQRAPVFGTRWQLYSITLNTDVFLAKVSMNPDMTIAEIFLVLDTEKVAPDTPVHRLFQELMMDYGGILVQAIDMGDTKRVLDILELLDERILE